MRGAAIPHGDSARRGGKSRFHSSTRPISRMPAGCMYFVSFYITGYPRDLDSIYFLLALRLECTRPIFDVGGRIFSGRNDRWIFLYFHSRSSPVDSFSRPPPRPRPHPHARPPGPSPSGTLASFNRDITLHTTANYEPKQHEIRSTWRYYTEPRWIPCSLFIFTCSQAEFYFSFNVFVLYLIDFFQILAHDCRINSNILLKNNL